MRSYAEAEVFSISEIQDLYRTTRLVHLLPGKDPGGDYVRCHELARVLAPLLFQVWEVVDGKYGPTEHSWLVNRDGHILEVYAVARLPQVQLVDGLWVGNYKRYRREEPRTDIRHGVVRYLSWILRPEDTCGRDTDRPGPVQESANQGVESLQDLRLKEEKDNASSGQLGESVRGGSRTRTDRDDDSSEGQEERNRGS